MLNRLASPFRLFAPRRRVSASPRPDSASPRPRVSASPRPDPASPRLRVPASLLARAQARFARSRPGSVLILVVALLVLMALIGTAFMSMAQSDRASSVQHENNTEIDLLLDSMISLVKGTVVADLYGNGQLRGGDNYSTDLPNTYNNVTGLGTDVTAAKSVTPPMNIGTSFLAPRVPELIQETAPGGSPSANGTANPSGYMPLWRYISAPIVGGSFASPVPMRTAGNATGFLTNQQLFPPYGYTQRSMNLSALPPQALYPWYMSMNGTYMPAWVDNPNNPQRVVLAADADGDGVADAGLVKLPMGLINGITYYVAVRIVDNAAAVNANVAWTHNPLSSITGYAPPQLPGDFFPTNIDLVGPGTAPMQQEQGLLIGADATNGMPALANYHFTGTAPAPVPPFATIGAYDDSGTLRGDFSFQTPFEAEWMQLGRRPWYPSLNSSGRQFTPLALSESLSLARDFIIRNPGTGIPLLESAFPLSLSGNAPTSPYSLPGSAPSGLVGQAISNWYNGNFSFLAQQYAASPYSANVPLRSILTTENGVGNFAPTKFTDMGTYTTTPPNPYQFGDMVTFTDPYSRLPHRYVCINPTQAPSVQPGPNAFTTVVLPVPTPLPSKQLPPTSTAWCFDNDTWVYEPWTNAPTKTNVNTATFGQLMLAYYQVMADQLATVPANNRTWAPAYPFLGTPTASARMFRSPLRYTPTATYKLSPTQVMQLRAAIAAVNTIDMRDGDDNISSRTVVLHDGLSPLPNVTATVYGQERQPFITQVYATDLQYPDGGNVQHNGFIAIEIYNPYTKPIDLTNYTLAYATRSSTPGTPLTFTALPWAGITIAGVTYNSYPPSAPVIPPRSSIIIASSGVTSTGTLDPTTLPPTGVANPPNLVFPASVVPAPVTYMPPTPATQGQIPLYVMTGLCPTAAAQPTVLGNELYLFRGRLEDTTKAIGTNSLTSWNSAMTTGATSPIMADGTSFTPFNEGLAGAPNPADMVPVDCYDFTGLPGFVGTAPQFTTAAGSANEWYYARPNPMGGGSGKSWHYVYPGHIAEPTYTTPPPNPTPRFIDGTAYTGGPNPNPAGAGMIPAGIDQVLQNARNIAGAKTTPLPPYTLPLGANKAYASAPYDLQNGTATATYQDIPLELNYADFGGPNAGRNSTLTGEPPAFPFGGFARNGDILEVPYIGSYRLMVQTTPTLWQVIEMNPVTMDSVMALGLAQSAWGETGGALEPTETPANPTGADPIFGLNATAATNFAVEQVGRFCPLGPADSTGAPTFTNFPNDYSLPVTGTVASPAWLYHWSTRLLDYLTVQSPQQDLMPDVDPGATDPNASNSPPYPPPAEYLPAQINVAYIPKAVANVTRGIFNGEPYDVIPGTEEAVTVEGLVNINTAPWRVLAAVPWVPTSYPNRVLDNANIAISIAYYRDVMDPLTGRPHGPFKSIFELAGVPINAAIAGSDITTPGLPLRNFFFAVNSAHPAVYSADEGDLTQVYSANSPDPVLGDFKSQYLMINRVSNLITTRSDSFTAYILLQGWRNAETPGATLAVQRRVAFLIDRSGVTPISLTPTINFVPNQ